MNTKSKIDAEKTATVAAIKAQTDMTKVSVKQTARELVDRVTSGRWLNVGERKQAAASHLDTATTAVLEAASRLRKDDQELVAKPLVSLANSVGQLGYFLDTNSPSELADKASDVVKKYPLTSLGGAFIIGAAAARLVRASSKA